MSSSNNRDHRTNRSTVVVGSVSAAIIGLLVVLMGVWWYNSAALEPTATIDEKRQTLGRVESEWLAGVQVEVRDARELRIRLDGQVDDPSVLDALAAAAARVPSSGYGAYEMPLSEPGFEHASALSELEARIVENVTIVDELRATVAAAEESHARWLAAQG